MVNLVSVMEKKYYCQFYFISQAFFYILTTIVLFFGLIYILIRYLHVHVLPEIGVVLFVFSLILPFLFQKRIKNCFKRNCVIEFDSKGFLIQFGRLYNKSKERTFKYNWADVKACKFYVSSSGFTVLDVFAFNRKHRKYIFAEDHSDSMSFERGTVFIVFLQWITQYNKTKEIDKRIEILKGFFATNIGTLVLWSIGLVIVIDIFLHLFKHDNNYGPVFLASVFYLSLFGLRRQQQLFYKKIANLIN